MKKLSIFLVATFMSFASVAQNTAVNKANYYHQDGDLVKAKENIDQAVKHEKTIEKGKTWYTKGLVYGAIAFSQDTTVTKLAPNALQEAVAAYQKAKTLLKEGSMYYKKSDEDLDNLWNQAINEGAVFYQDGNYGSAYRHFVNATKVRPQDTTAYIYAGYSALQNKQYDDAIANFTTLVDLNYNKPEVYTTLIALHRSHERNDEKALEVVQVARQRFPENKEIKKEEINLLIVTKKIEVAKSKLENAIKEDPNNAVMYYNLAFLYEQLNDKDNARKNYALALEKDPNYFEASFNLGASYYNAAAEALKKADDMDFKTYQKEGKKLEAQAKDLFNQALPSLEQARKIRPNDEDVLRTLQVIYTRLNMKDKASEVGKALEKI
jgi:tetratricopeptide (TPR) repeat protein